MGKIAKRTSRVRHATTPVRPLKKKVRRTQVQPAIQNQKEQHSATAHVEVKTDDISACDKEVQTEAQSSEETRTIVAERCNKNIQVNLPLTTTMWDSGPRTVTLREGLMQAQQAVEKLTEKMVSREKYEELQQQLRNVNLSESQDFEGWRKEEERVTKVTHRLDVVIKQMDTLCSLYTDVLACRAPAKNYALFLMERYLHLKIKAVKAGAPIQINTIDDFINCCKHYGVKVQRLLCEFYLHNLVLDQEIE